MENVENFGGRGAQWVSDNTSAPVNVNGVEWQGGQMRVWDPQNQISMIMPGLKKGDEREYLLYNPTNTQGTELTDVEFVPFPPQEHLDHEDLPVMVRGLMAEQLKRTMEAEEITISGDLIDKLIGKGEVARATSYTLQEAGVASGVESDLRSETDQIDSEVERFARELNSGALEEQVGSWAENVRPEDGPEQGPDSGRGGR